MALNKVKDKVSDYGTLVMFSHTIFSLSFAVISMVLASDNRPNFNTVFWILIGFLAARTGANAINRVIDAEIDGANPRTRDRQLPQGKMNKFEIIIFVIMCFITMVYAAWKLNPICFMLSPIALFLLIIYSYTKRFTWACHLILGITSAAAPVGAWIAVTGRITLIPLVMGAANTLWVAGFDIIYGAQDYEFDTTNGIYSIPARFGVKKALIISKVFHIITMLLLISLGIISKSLGIIYFSGLAIIAVLFFVQHKMVSPDNLSNVRVASYNINQIISVTFLVFGLLDALI